MDSVADWIDAKPPRGNYTFTREEVVEAFPRMKPEVISTTQLLQKNEMSGGIGSVLAHRPFFIGFRVKC